MLFHDPETGFNFACYLVGLVILLSVIIIFASGLFYIFYRGLMCIYVDAL